MSPGSTGSIVDLPKFVAADAYRISSATGSGVGSGKRPMKFGSGRRVFQLIERHHHVGKIAHKSARNLGDRDRRSAVYTNRTALCINEATFSGSWLHHASA